MALARELNMAGLLSRGGDVSKQAEALVADLVKRVNIPINSTSSPGLVAAVQQDPWKSAGKYGLGWLYFGLILLLAATTKYLYQLWGDKIRTALHKEEFINSAMTMSPDSPYELPSAISATTADSHRHFFPARGPLPGEEEAQASMWNITIINNVIALFRWIFYRPIPALRIWKLHFVFPSLGVVVLVLAGLAFCMLYTFLPQPYYYPSMAYGSPPLAIRAGFLSLALLPWIVALASKANFISVMTGIGHDRLNVLHRWAAYLCILLALIHAIPFWIQSARDPNGFAIFKLYFNLPGNGGFYIFGTGIAALVPLALLFIHSLSFLRAWMYELFVTLHAPLAWIFAAMMFWHCNKALTSWNYLYATVALMFASYIMRLFYLNWTNPFRASWLIGEEAAVTILPENAVKVTIPTQKKWKPGQYAYLRMPGIAMFENHPFTIASLCSDDFPSEYDEQYRDMTLVFRPFGGFTRKVYDTAIEKGPYKTYRAFIDGPYGGMHRDMASFDQVIFFAGGSGITAIASQLLDLIKRMRDGKAVTKTVRVVWALKRPETMEWFKEELRICREYAPPDSVHCQFFITASKRYEPEPSPNKRPHSGFFNDKLGEKVNDALQGVASKRNSALFQRDASQEIEREAAMQREKEDEISALPQAFLAPPKQPFALPRNASPNRNSIQPVAQPSRTFDFGFPQTPSKFQKSLMRFAFLPSNRRDGWRTEYGRPDIPYMLKRFSKDFGRKTCVYVCGPPSMRLDVANTVAKLQSDVWTNSAKDEIFLHAENYAI